MKRLTREEEAALLYECLFCCRKGKEKFARQYWKLVFHTIRKSLNYYKRSDLFGDIEDIRNEAFIRLFDKDCRKLWQYKLPYEGGKTSLAGWIMLITTQTVTDYIPPHPKPPDQDEPDDWLKRIQRLIRDNFEELSPRDRRLLKLRYYFGYTSKEIAELSQKNPDLDIPGTPGATDIAIHRALKKLKKLVVGDLESE